jgi:diaminopimelate decarboxylase
MDKFNDCRFYFAVKSNNHPVVAKTVLESDFGLDVSSGKELKMSLDLGAEDILFTGPGKTSNELILAVENSEKVTILIDSFHELHALEKIAASKKALIKAGVRLSTNTTGLWRKFGIALDDLPEFFKQAENCPHINIQGLQFHTSWNLSPKAQTDFISLLGKELATYPAFILKKIQFVDIGGGYWPLPGEWLHGESVPYYHPATSIETFAEQLSQAIYRHLDFLLPCRIYFEPGRWICNDSMHLMMSVVDKKAPDLVITDSGINAIGWERFEKDYFPILNLTRPSLTEKPCNICGSLCTPHDLFGFSYFGEDICIGDVLLIPCQGAYTYSLKQDFIKPTPKVVTIIFTPVTFPPVTFP